MKESFAEVEPRIGRQNLDLVACIQNMDRKEMKKIVARMVV